MKSSSIVAAIVLIAVQAFASERKGFYAFDWTQGSRCEAWDEEGLKNAGLSCEIIEDKKRADYFGAEVKCANVGGTREVLIYSTLSQCEAGKAEHDANED